MAVIGFFVVVPVLLLLVVGVVVAVVLAVSGRPDGTLPSEVTAARRHAVATSAVAGLVAVLACLVLTLALSSLGRGVPARLLATLPLVGAGLALLVLLLGELTWPRQVGTTRVARLQDRSVGSVVRGRWARAAAVVVTAFVVLVVVAGVLAAPGGESIGRRSGSAGPFPGWAYGLPQLVVLAGCVAVALLVGRAAAHRSAVVTADVDTDMLLRRASAARAWRVIVAATLVTLGADLFVAGSAAANLWSDGGPAAVTGTVVMALGPLVALGGLGTLFVPVPRLPAAATRLPPGPALTA